MAPAEQADVVARTVPVVVIAFGRPCIDHAGIRLRREVAGGQTAENSIATVILNDVVCQESGACYVCMDFAVWVFPKEIMFYIGRTR